MKKMLLILFLFISNTLFAQDVVSTLFKADSATIHQFMSKNLPNYIKLELDSSNMSSEFFLNTKENENGIISYFFYFDMYGCNSIRLIFSDYIKFNKAINKIASKFIKMAHATYYDKENDLIIKGFVVRQDKNVLYFIDIVPYHF